MSDSTISRRDLLAGAAAVTGSALLGALPAQAQHPAKTPPAPAPAAPGVRAPGAPTTAVGQRSAFVNPQRAPVGEITGTASTPLQALRGTITPADLHFTRIHDGIPAIDPATHRLLVHGL